VGEGGPGDYGFQYVDSLEETQIVFLNATYTSELGFYEAEEVSFFLDEMCNGVVPVTSVYIEPTQITPITLPPTS
jgi:hypothetical protein